MRETRLNSQAQQTSKHFTRKLNKRAMTIIRANLLVNTEYRYQRYKAGVAPEQLRHAYLWHALTLLHRVPLLQLLDGHWSAVRDSPGLPYGGKSAFAETIGELESEIRRAFHSEC